MTKKLTFVLLVIALFFFVNLAVADMYKWVDQNGAIHFSDTPPSTENQVETIETTNYPASNPESAPIKRKILPQPTKKDESQKKVFNKRKRQRIISKGVEIYPRFRTQQTRNNDIRGLPILILRLHIS